MENSTTTNYWSSVATHTFHWSLIISGSATLAMNALFSCMFVEFRKALLTNNSNNKILLSMTLADSLVGISSILLGSLLMFRRSQTIYKIFGILPLFGSMFTSILSLGILTVDRLIAVKFPLQYKSIMYPSPVKTLIIISWVVPVIITLQESLVYIYASWQFELKLRGFILSAFFITGSTLLLIANIRLCFAIRKHMKFLQNHSNAGLYATRRQSLEMQDEQGLHPLFCFKKISESARAFFKEIRAAKTCIIITVIFVACWAPLTAYRFSYSIGHRVGIPWLRRTCLLSASLNSLLNPLVYLMTRNGFRFYMWRIRIMKLMKKLVGYNVSGNTGSHDEYALW